MNLRPYQEEAHTAISKELRLHDDTLLCLPTGTGKTFTAASWLHKQEPTKVLWLAHRIELVDQAYEAFKRLKVKASKWTAEEKDASGTVVVSTILSTRELHQAVPEVDFLVVDEAHHWPMASYSGPTGIKHRIKYKKLLGLTATPARLDKKELNFSSIAYQKSFLDMVGDKWLAIPQYVMVKSKIKMNLTKTGGDFTAASLAQVNNQARNEIVQSLYNDRREALGKTLVFAVNIEHANALASLLGAVAITQETTKKRRQEIIQDFRDGQIKCLVNCLVFTEGFDVPSINTIILARPTASKTLYMQMIGRGSRICEGKTTFNIIDIVDNERHYSVLTQIWSKEEFGAGGNIPEMSARKDRVEKYTKAEKLDLSKLLLKWQLSKFDVAGIIQYDVFGEQQAMLLTLPQVEAILMYQDQVARETELTTDLIYTMYSILAAESGLKISEWKNICYAIWYTIKRGTKDASLTIFCGDRIMKANGSQSFRLEELLRVSELVNKDMPAFIQNISDKLKGMVSENIYNTFGRSGFRYVNGVLEVTLPVTFNQLRYFLPARLLIREIVNEYLDTEIVEVTYALTKQN